MTEAELCEEFMRLAESHGWTCYPETSGWDILLTQQDVYIGVQAKKHCNIKVIDQAMPSRYQMLNFLEARPAPTWRKKSPVVGPEYRTILVPKPDGAFVSICEALGLWVFDQQGFGAGLLKMFTSLPSVVSQQWESYLWPTDQKCWIPDVVPKVAAGVPSPVSLTQWKQGALKFLARSVVQGYVTSRDAKEQGVSMQIFIDRTFDPWMERCGKAGRLHKWKLLEAYDGTKRPDKQHPHAFDQFVSELRSQVQDVHAE